MDNRTLSAHFGLARCWRSCPKCLRRQSPGDFQGRGVNRGTPRSLGRLVRVSLMILALCLCATSLASAQGQERKRHVPGLDKISGGSTNQAFSGIVQSLDMKRSILNVNTVQGGVTEIFPIKKGMHVESADGDKLKLAELKPGTNVLIYYSQKGDRRTVKQIVVLAGEPATAKKVNPHS